MSGQRRLRIVDVFTRVPFKGNPVAVVLDGSGLDTAAMQAIANWTNLSETTFVLPAGDTAADYGLRIFTPRAELPFAGHPTIGSAYAVLDAGIARAHDGRLTQQCGVGLVEISVPEGWREEGVSFRLPRHSLAAAPEAAELEQAVSSHARFADTPAIVDVGPRWVIGEYADAAMVRSLKPDLAALGAYDRRHGTTGLTVFAPEGAGLVVRSFAPADGIAEDPVCGSGNGAVAAYRQERGRIAGAASYRSSQGREVGRDGSISIRHAADGIHIGGQAVICVEGMIRA